MHLLSQGTVRLLWKWRVRGTDLFYVYDQLGSKKLSEQGQDRLERYFEWVKKYRNEYRDIAYTALLSLRADYPDLKMELTIFRSAGAKEAP